MRLFLLAYFRSISLTSLSLEDEADKGKNANEDQTDNGTAKAKSLGKETVNGVDHAKLNVENLNDSPSTECGETDHLKPLTEDKTEKNYNACSSACEDEVAADALNDHTGIYNHVGDVCESCDVNHHVDNLAKKDRDDTYNDCKDPAEISDCGDEICNEGYEIHAGCAEADSKRCDELLETKKTLTEEKLDCAKSDQDVRYEGVNHCKHTPNLIPKAFNLTCEAAVPQLLEELADCAEIEFSSENLVDKFHTIPLSRCALTRPNCV